MSSLRCWLKRPSRRNMIEPVLRYLLSTWGRLVRRLLRLSVALTVLATTFAAATNAQGRFSLEQILSTPFPSELTASPTGGAVAWIQNDRGRRNIWVARAPEFVGRQVTDFDRDDGQEISDLQFTVDGGSLLYVHGGGPNRQGEIPNPESSADATKRAVWMIALANGDPHQLAEGSSPLISPDSRWVAFLHRGQVWRVAIGEDEEPEQLFQIRGRAGSLRWSPDGSKLAFVSGRGDHSFVGVYDLERRAIAYLDPSVDRDGNPVWSPDGRQLAYIRLPRQGDVLPFMPRREGAPWSIRVADVETGAARAVWTAHAGPGSVFRGVVARNQLFWGAGERVVFPWEKDGWTHLYSVPLRGGRATLLTPGAFEVEDVVITADGEHLVYSSNQDDIDRRHLWRVPAAGGTPLQLTSGAGNEWSPTLAQGEVIAHFASDARQPAHAVIRLPGGTSRPMARSSLPGDFPLDRLIVPQQVVFPAADGLRIHGQLFLPPSARRGERHPAVLFFHGGSRRQMLLGWHYRGYYHNAYALNQYLASRGYIVLSVNYRSGIGYGMEFREALNYGARGASEFNDVLGAGLYLAGRPDVDPDRIGLWGGSYGGYLTALGLARASDLFAAGVDIHGVHDWNVVIRNFRPGYDPVSREEVARLAFESSPMAFIDTWRSPVLLIHGDDDRNVPFSETVDLIDALRVRGVEYEQLVFPDEVHGFLLHRNWLAAYRATADFFDRKLMRRDDRVSGSDD